MKNNGLVPNRNTYNILVHGYCKLKWLKEAVEVTELMTGNDMLPDVWTYNTMVRGLCDEGKIDEAVRLRDEMESLRLVPDGGSAAAFKLVEEMKSRGVKENAVTHNIMVKWFCKEGNVDEASNAMAKMSESGFLLIVLLISYNMMINGYCKAGKMAKAFKMMDEMGRKGLKTDTFTLNTILYTLCLEKKLDDAYN
ncbi:putative pentatricopeptide [Medicago truncatula]|uniref:Putative pentatricopeptide n=1 Tax=Medicago truncatula TaxID=3880 RepID=A0A396H4Y0_MEDTR|nr:putative pentatricopeptide [Medicago truncatula]